MSRLQTDDKSPFVTLGRVLMVLLCLSTVWVIYETFTLTEDERISAATEAFFQAVEDEDEATVNVLLLEPFDFSGPAPIRAGDRIDAALSDVNDLEKGFTLFASHNGRIGLAYENLVAPVVIQVDR